jgi:hypothetical protein
MIESNLSQVLKDLAKLEPEKMEWAIKQASVSAMGEAKKVIKQGIKQNYTLKPKELDRRTKLTKDSLDSTLTIWGVTAPKLGYFKINPTSPVSTKGVAVRNRKKAVSEQRKGNKHTHQHSFVATMGKSTGIFYRTGEKTKTGKNALKYRVGDSVASIVENTHGLIDKAQEAMASKLEEAIFDKLAK